MTGRGEMADLIETLAGIVGARHVLIAPGDQEAYTTDWLKTWSGRAAAVVRPAWNALSLNAGFRRTLSHFAYESERALVENPH